MPKFLLTSVIKSAIWFCVCHFSFSLFLHFLLVLRYQNYLMFQNAFYGRVDMTELFWGWREWVSEWVSECLLSVVHTAGNVVTVKWNHVKLLKFHSFFAEYNSDRANPLEFGVGKGEGVTDEGGFVHWLRGDAQPPLNCFVSTISLSTIKLRKLIQIFVPVIVGFSPNNNPP